jgi:hypothetical protein
MRTCVADCVACAVETGVWRVPGALLAYDFTDLQVKGLGWVAAAGGKVSVPCQCVCGISMIESTGVFASVCVQRCLCTCLPAHVLPVHVLLKRSSDSCRS